MTVRRTLFSGDVYVDHGQVCVESVPDGLGPGLTESLAGQVNGLCGAAVPGTLLLVTGLHTGHVGFVAELHDGLPAVDGGWEEVVEASFAPSSADVALARWDGETYLALGLARGRYRVRYCASGMDLARRVDTRLDWEPVVDRYLLQFWPSPPERDRVLRQTSETAAYWHRYARELPPAARS